MTKFISWEDIFNVSEIRTLEKASGERHYLPKDVINLFNKKGFNYYSCCSFSGLQSQLPNFMVGPYESDFHTVQKWCKMNLDKKFSTYIGYWFFFESKEDRFKFELMWS